jgi:hypothetical protein
MRVSGSKRIYELGRTLQFSFSLHTQIATPAGAELKETKAPPKVGGGTKK